MDDAVGRYMKASEAGDIEGIMAAVGPEPEVVSPLSGRMVFRGREDVEFLFAAVYGTLKAVRWARQLGDGEHRVALGEARLGPLRATDAMVLELAPDGRIRRFSPHLRPWLALTVFALLLGPKMARRPAALWRALRG